MKIYKKILDAFVKCASVLLVLTVCGIVMIMLNELIIRNVFNKSFRGMTELAGLLFLWMAFLGITVLYDKDALISLDIVYSRTTGFLQNLFWYIRHIVVLALGFVMIIAFCGLYPFVITEFYSSMPGFSKMWQFLPLAVSGAFFVLKALYNILERQCKAKAAAK
ncbi:TRAP transporter small permease [Treponema sp. OMZ 840]|uniref:TRAP transporter small permease n=1 Tax=Treponema sp. OMZ 840 TaxID=244313 RepID=UPI003D89C8BB